ncbi:MAG: NAD(P)H-dependent oxidoreductase [Gammaproteobacteria bacterium]
MNLVEALNWRYAVKKFTADKIPASQVKDLLNATRLSASAYGLQPYALVVVESQDVRQQLLAYSYGQDKIAQSSHLIVFAAHTELGDSTVDRYIDKYAQMTNKSSSELSGFSAHMKSALARMTIEQRKQWAHQQAYIALGNFLTCAALMKIDCCPMSGFDKKGYDTVLRLAEKGLTSTVICPVGRRHPEDQQARKPKVRFDYDELVLEI